MNLILFGPPGVGKTTLIGALKSESLRAVDLEDVYPSRVRFQMPSQLTNVVIGGADLNPIRSYPGNKKVLLSMPQLDYERRRSRRDSLQPAKASQQTHQVSDWIGMSKWDYTLDASQPINVMVKQLRTIMQKEGMI